MEPRICDYFPVPDLLKAKTLLCIQPHPDDMEIGAGATVALMARAGAAVTCLTVTDGSAGTHDPNKNQNELAEIRRLEAEEGANILGVQAMIRLEFADAGYLPLEAVRSEITRVIRMVRPEAVMVCDPWLPYEAHSDHVQTGRAAAEACFLAGMPYFHPADIQEGLEPFAVQMVAFYYTAFPNTFLDVSACWDLKMAAIDCHVSQFPPEEAKVLKGYLDAKARSHAKERGCEFVEALKVLSRQHLHIVEEAWQC